MRIGSAFGTARFQPRNRVLRYAAVNSAAPAALMRHFLPPARPPRPLPGGMPMRTATPTLVASARPAHRLASADPCALTRTVDVAVIAAAANLHLHPAASAVVEPIRRLPQRPQCPLPQHWTALGKSRHKGPAQLPLPGTAHRGLRGLTSI